MYPVFAAVELFSIYQALKHVHLQTLTKVGQFGESLPLSLTFCVRVSIACPEKIDHVSSCFQDRLEIIIDRWVQSGRVPSPAEVSQEEGVDLLNLKGWPSRPKPRSSPISFLKIETSSNSRSFCPLFSGDCRWPIRIGCVDPRFQISAFSSPALQRLSNEDSHFICLETVDYRRGSGPKVNLTVLLLNDSLYI